jgi:hypothetical protein
MLKASALYMVIIIALVIAVICSSLIVTAYFYRLQNQKMFRYTQLLSNVNSGVNILLAGQDTSYTEKTMSLFNGDEDSVTLKRIAWGIYDIGVSSAFTQHDTLYKVFSIGYTIDSTKWAALYVADDQRPIGLSGNMIIEGDAYIPVAGVNAAYADGKYYNGDKRLIIGIKHNSEKVLPALQDKRLGLLEQYFNTNNPLDTAALKQDSLFNSFLSPVKYISFGKNVSTISHTHLSGNIILLSDTLLNIDSTASLNNVLVFAKSIVVHSGFKGNCQFFATDSISIGRNCVFNYPSCLGVLGFKNTMANIPTSIRIGSKTQFSGTVFTYEKANTASANTTINNVIDIGKQVKIHGQVYSANTASLRDSCEIDGSVFSNQFLYKTSYTMYVNYLINVKMDEKALSPYYLGSELLPVAGKRKRVLQWLEQK